MKIRELFEETEKSLIGMEISGHSNFANKPWQKEWEAFIIPNKKIGQEITSLKGAPSSVAQSFVCFENSLTSLKYVPDQIGGNLSLAHNNISAFDNDRPITVWGFVNLTHNKFTSLHNIHKYFSEIREYIDFTGNEIESHVLGLLKIKKLKYVYLNNNKVQMIINKYLPLGNVYDCQEELIEAGFEEYAQL